MDTSSKFKTDLQVDSPVEITASLRTDTDDRRKIDNQIIAIEEKLVSGLVNGVLETTVYLSGTSAAVTGMDCVCLSSEDPIDGIPVVTKAVAAALTNAKSVCGIVRVGATPGARLRIAIGGMLAPSDTGLTFASGGVRCNIVTARPERVVTIGANDYPIGTVDSRGNLNIAVGPTPTVAGSGGGGGGGAASPALNPLDYGLLWNDTVDDLPAWNAMLAGIDATEGAMIQLPAGSAYFAGDLRINRKLFIQGAGGGNGYRTCEMRFAPGYGIKIDGDTTSTDGNSGLGTVIKDVDIASTRLLWRGAGIQYGTGAIWAPSTYFPKGTCFKNGSDLNQGYYYEVTTAGTTNAGAEPTWSLTPGGTTTSGTLVTTTKTFPALWQAVHAYVIGDRVQVPNDNRYYFQCSVAGTSGATYPTDMDGPELAATIVDGGGTLRWVTRTHAAILSQTRCHVEHVYGVGFTNCGGLHVQALSAGTPSTNANWFTCRNITVQFSGMCCHFNGSDANGWTAGQIFAQLCGYQQAGTGGHTIWNHSQAGGLVEGAYGEAGTGASLWENINGSVSTYINCFSECVPGDRLLINTLRINGTSGNDPEPLNVAVCLHGGTQGQLLIEYDKLAGGQGPVAGLTNNDGLTVHWMSNTDDHLGNQKIGWRYQYTPSNGYNAGTGNWAFSYGTVNGSCAIGITGNKSALGPGNWIDYKGHFVGSTAKQFRGQDVVWLRSVTINGGRQEVGSKFSGVGISTGAAGGFDTYVVSVAGWRGPAWTANTAYRLADAYYNIFQDTVEPTTYGTLPAGGRNVWRCKVAGTSHATTEPVWPGSPASGDVITDGTVTWEWITGYTTPTYTKTELCHDRGGSITTTNNTANQVAWSRALTDNAVNTIRLRIEGYEAATGDGAMFEVSAIYSKKAAAYIILQAPAVDKSKPNTIGGAWAGVIARNGANVEAQVTGDTAKTIVWKVMQLDQEQYA